MKKIMEELKSTFENVMDKLRGRDKRIFAAQLAIDLGWGGQTAVSKALGISRITIQKGINEIETGVVIVDDFGSRGRKKAEEHLPNLMIDIKSIVDSQSQTDPDFKTNRLYTRISAETVRKQLIIKKGYTDEELPSRVTIGKKLNKLGYTLKKVNKTKPLKKR